MAHRENDLVEALLKTNCILRDAVVSIDRLSSEIRTCRARIEFSRLQATDLVTNKNLAKTERRIMEAIQTFAARVEESFNKIHTGVEAIVDDVTFLKEEIAKLNENVGGDLSEEDSAALERIATRAEELANKVQTLDQQTQRPPAPV